MLSQFAYFARRCSAEKVLIEQRKKSSPNPSGMLMMQSIA